MQCCGLMHSQVQVIWWALEDQGADDKTRQDKTRQDKTRQDKTRQDKPSQAKPKQDKPRQDKPSQDKTRQDKARQGKARFKSEEQTHTIRLCGETRRRGDLIGKQPLHQHIQMLLRLDIYELPERPVVICSLLSQAYKPRTGCMRLDTVITRSQTARLR